MRTFLLLIIIFMLASHMESVGTLGASEEALGDVFFGAMIAMLVLSVAFAGYFSVCQIKRAVQQKFRLFQIRRAQRRAWSLRHWI